MKKKLTLKKRKVRATPAPATPMVKEDMESTRAKMTLMIPRHLLKAVREQARFCGLSQNGFICNAIKGAVFPVPQVGPTIINNPPAPLDSRTLIRTAQATFTPESVKLRKQFDRDFGMGYTVDAEGGDGEEPIHASADWEEIERFDVAYADPKNQKKSIAAIGQLVGLPGPTSQACYHAIIDESFARYQKAKERLEAAEVKEREALHA